MSKIDVFSALESIAPQTIVLGLSLTHGIPDIVHETVACSAPIGIDQDEIYRAGLDLCLKLWNLVFGIHLQHFGSSLHLSCFSHLSTH